MYIIALEGKERQPSIRIEELTERESSSTTTIGVIKLKSCASLMLTSKKQTNKSDSQPCAALNATIIAE